MVICLERGADLHMAQLMPLQLTVSCFSKIQIGFTFLVPAYPGSPRQRAVKRVCVCSVTDFLVPAWYADGVHNTLTRSVNLNVLAATSNGIQAEKLCTYKILQFYRAMLCICGTSHGPVSVSVCFCVRHKPFY